MLRLLPTILLATALASTAHAGVYEDPDVLEIAATHQIIAILPCATTVLDSRGGKNRMTPEEMVAAEEAYATMFQDAMYSWFLQAKQRGKLRPDVQDVEETRVILMRNGITTEEDLAAHTKQELADMLDVDAVFSSTATTTTTFSKGGAIALSILLGAYASTGEADVMVKLHSGPDGKVIWSFDRKVRGTYTTDPDDLVDYLMKRVSRRFPYKHLD